MRDPARPWLQGAFGRVTMIMRHLRRIARGMSHSDQGVRCRPGQAHGAARRSRLRRVGRVGPTVGRGSAVGTYRQTVVDLDACAQEAAAQGGRVSRWLEAEGFIRPVPWRGGVVHLAGPRWRDAVDLAPWDRRARIEESEEEPCGEVEVVVGRTIFFSGGACARSLPRSARTAAAPNPPGRVRPSTPGPPRAPPTSAARPAPTALRSRSGSGPTTASPSPTSASSSTTGRPCTRTSPPPSAGRWVTTPACSNARSDSATAGHPRSSAFVGRELRRGGWPPLRRPDEPVRPATAPARGRRAAHPRVPSSPTKGNPASRTRAERPCAPDPGPWERLSGSR